VGDAHIYRAEAHGASAVRLTRVGVNLLPAWSPDGRWISFLRPDMPPDDRTPAQRQQGPGHAIFALAVAFVRFRFTDDITKLRAHLRALPRDEGRPARLSLALAAILVLATPVLASLAPHLRAVPFRTVTDAGGFAGVSTPALTLALAAFAVAWGYLLAAAAQGPGLLWVVAGLLYVYQVWPIGFPLGRSFLQLIPIALPVVIGSLTPHGPAWGKIVLAVLLATIGARSLPVSMGSIGFWPLWGAVSAGFLAVHFLLVRHPWVVGRRLALAVSVLLAYFLLVALVSGSQGAMAGVLNGSLNDSLWFLMILWFLLGASFVSGAIALARFARDGLEMMIPRSAPIWVLVAGWGVLSAWVLRLPATDVAVPLRPIAAALVGAGLVAVAIRWKTQGMTRQWLSTAFVVTASALVILEAAVTLDLGETLKREAGAFGVLAFVYALVWEVTGRIPGIPGEIRGLARPGPLLLYLGMTLLVGAASLFGFAANLSFFQRAALLAQFQGAIALWSPVLLWTLLRTSPMFPSEAGQRVLLAFAVGVLLAVPGLAIRVAFPLRMVDTTLVLAVVGTAVLAARRSGVRLPVPSAAIGYALAYGFAASLSYVILIPVLAGLLNVGGSLFLLDPLNNLSRALFEMAIAHSWGAVEQQLFFVIMPFAAALSAFAAAFLATRTAPPVPQDGA
jgi:hypothetical protein